MAKGRDIQKKIKKKAEKTLKEKRKEKKSNFPVFQLCWRY